LLICFKDQNIRWADGAKLFDRREPLRFEWIALLAYRRAEDPPDSNVSFHDVARLPHWKGMSKRNIVNYVGRYLKGLESIAPDLIVAERRFAGPYRLGVDPLAISFDLPMSHVRHKLGILKQAASKTTRDNLLRFTLGYVRAQWLLFRGRLRSRGPGKLPQSAYEALMVLADDFKFGTTLRLLARLAAVDVLFRLGRYRAARGTLLGSRKLARDCPTYSLKARFHLALAWTYQRSSTGARSNRAVEAQLGLGRSDAESGGDRAALGLLALRKAGYLTKSRRYLDAVNEYATALEAYLIVGNYNGVLTACADLGSAMHRLGETYYPEVRRWILASVLIARWMGIGRDDAHGEMILAKLYIESKRKMPARRLLERAERIASAADNRVNLGDIKMVWGLWHQQFGAEKQLVRTLAEALTIFEGISEFDVPQKKKYMAHSFPLVWNDVLRIVEASKTDP
jgi:hypothetical protein